MTEQPQSTIRFSIVTAVYNVSRYLGEFIESVENQAFPRDQFEVIAVNDGSTDASLSLLEAWEAKRPGLVRVVSQSNAGLPAARNAGLPHVRGEWVTFADPDDRLAPNYLAEVAKFIETHPGVSMVATRLLVLNDATGELVDTHPLRRRFQHGDRLRNLDEYPDHFHGHAPSAFFRSSEIHRQGLTFDPDMRPQFEDGLFSGMYLLGIDNPSVGFVTKTAYEYRQRSDGSSMQQGILGKEGRYTTVLRRGFLALLVRGAEITGTDHAPEWLQEFIVYQLSWFFSSQEASPGVVSGTVAPVADEFHDLVRRILRYISDDTIRGFAVRPLKPVWEDVLLHGYDDQPWHTPYGLVTNLDRDASLVRVTYRYIGEPPTEELLSGGRVVAAIHGKVRDYEYLGRVMIRERIAWISAGQSVRVRLNGRDLDLQFTPRRRNHTLRPGQIRDYFVRKRPARRVSLADRIVFRVARTRIVRRLLRNSWVLMDRITDANDNAEHLFRYLRTERRDINAWFVIQRGSPDWHRLRRARLGRVVSHGSVLWKLLMANCHHYISSHIDVPVVQPPAIVDAIKPGWRFTFLGHGVTQRDLSSWFNMKQIDVLVASTPAEYDAYVKDHTLYSVTTKETQLTGMPRFDRLLSLDRQWSDAKRDLILVAPTWRAPLAPPVRAGSHVRTINPAFLDSAYARNWLGFLQAPELHEACERLGLTIGFLPHPNLQPALSLIELPPSVRPMTFVGDVQELFARAAVLITDYSSMAFDAAYINRPIVYFQFDTEDMKRGAHFGRHGYFDYERDGFGPVAYSLGDAITAAVATIEFGPTTRPEYRERIDRAFPARDGRCSERTVDAVLMSAVRVRLDQEIPSVPQRERIEVVR